MSDQSGRKISFGIGKETPRSTAVAPSYWIQHLVADFQQKNTKVFNESVLGVLDKFNAGEIVKDWSEGKIEGKVTDKTFGLLLLSLMGQDTPTLHSGETIVYDHTYTPTNTNTHPSLTVTRKDTNSNLRFPNCMIKQMDITVVVGDFVKYTVEFMGKKGATASDTVTYVSENEFKPKYAVMKTASLVGGLGAATAVPIKSFKITITKGLQEYLIVGSNDPQDFFNTEFNVSGDFILRYSDQTYENLYYNNTYQALQLDLKNTDVTLGSATNPELLLKLPRVLVNTWVPDQKIDQMSEQTISFQGLFDQTTTQQLSVVLTNLVTSY